MVRWAIELCELEDFKDLNDFNFFKVLTDLKDLEYLLLPYSGLPFARIHGVNAPMPWIFTFLFQIVLPENA